MSINRPELHISTKNSEYYRPTSRQLRISANTHIEGLIIRSVTHLFSNEVTKDHGKNKETRILFFNNGDKPYLPTSIQERQRFDNDTLRSVLPYVYHMFSSKGELLEEYQTQWYNIVEIVPQVVKILSSHKNHIDMVQKNHSINLITSAIQLAMNPDTTLAVRMGFGGSDDNFTSNRLAAYAIPALEIVDQLNKFYADRLDEKVRNSFIQSKFKEEIEKQNGTPLTRQQKKDLTAKVEKEKLYLSITDEEKTAIAKKYGVLTQQPRVQLFFAYEAAKAINHSMDPTKITLRAHENIAELERFVNQNYPDIADQVDYLTDKPWDRNKPHRKIIIEYLANLVRQSTSESVKETLDTLQSLGENHGGENGFNQAAEYAAMHPIAFGDRLDLPYINYLNNSRPANIVITIGGRTERHFCAVRDYLSNHANPTGLIDFIKRKSSATKSPEERKELFHTLKLVNRWKKIIDAGRKQEADQPIEENSILRPDQTSHNISLITDLGYTPTYYNSEFDRPNSHNVSQHLRELVLIGDLLEQSKCDNTSITELALKKDKLSGVIKDLEAIREIEEKRN